MRYSANHKLETREKLLQSSSVSAKKSGFSTVGVDGLMKAIGLSGGRSTAIFRRRTSCSLRLSNESYARALSGWGQRRIAISLSAA